jgi:hypothetical protein
MASGSERRQRNRLISLRLSDGEFNRIAARADACGLGVSGFLRASGLDGDAGPRAHRRPPADHKVLRQILGELGRVGNNINQIARALNSGDRARLPELPEALKVYLEVRKAILDALGKNNGPGPKP